MADHHEHIDLTTLREVQRLLSTTEFASIEDLAQRTNLSSMPASSGAGAIRSADGPTLSTEGTASLPKRS